MTSSLITLYRCGFIQGELASPIVGHLSPACLRFTFNFKYCTSISRPLRMAGDASSTCQLYLGISQCQSVI